MTLCDVYCDVLGISLCRSIGHVCTFHFKSFDIITPSNLADGTILMFVLLIVIGSKILSDFVNDIPCTLIHSTGNHQLVTL